MTGIASEEKAVVKSPKPKLQCRLLCPGLRYHRDKRGHGKSAENVAHRHRTFKEERSIHTHELRPSMR